MVLWVLKERRSLKGYICHNLESFRHELQKFTYLLSGRNISNNKKLDVFICNFNLYKLLFADFPFTRFLPYSMSMHYFVCRWTILLLLFILTVLIPRVATVLLPARTNYNLNFSKPCGMTLVTSGNQSQTECKCNQVVITQRCFADSNLYCTKCNYFVVVVITLLFPRMARQLIVSARLLSSGGSHFVS